MNYSIPDYFMCMTHLAVEVSHIQNIDCSSCPIMFLASLWWVAANELILLENVHDRIHFNFHEHLRNDDGWDPSPQIFQHIMQSPSVLSV